MKAIGTILPTKESLRLNDEFACKVEHLNAMLAVSHPILKDCEATKENGETRFYVSNSCYAIISRSQKVLWFEIRKDGEYSISSPIFA